MIVLCFIDGIKMSRKCKVRSKLYAEDFIPITIEQINVGASLRSTVITKDWYNIRNEDTYPENDCAFNDESIKFDSDGVIIVYEHCHTWNHSILEP